jgi:riboflavin kinase/FMN adenylyltransferase
MLFSGQSGIIREVKALHTVWGKAIAGSKRGKSLGFPTVNISLHREISEGVYLSEVRVNSDKFSSLTFVGAAKTFAQENKKVESYILNFNKNIYGKWITVRLFNKIRGNIKFKSEKELVEQIKKDLLVAKRFYSNSK